MGSTDIFEQSGEDETLGDRIIETIVSMYEKSQRQQPKEEPHIWLGNAWLGRAEAEHGIDINDPKMLKIALYETYLCACVKPPLCSRALGLYFLFKEHPAIIEKHTRFAEEFDELISPVVKARDNDTIDELYRTYNPTMADQTGAQYIH